MTISLVGAWTLNVHATPIYTTTIGVEEHELVDTASIQPALDAGEIQAMAVEELLSTASFGGVDEPIGWQDGTVDFSHDTENIHVGGFDQDRSAAGTQRDVDLPSSYTNYYYYLALVPLGLIGFTILKGWRTWRRERALDLHASRHARPLHRTGVLRPS